MYIIGLIREMLYEVVNWLGDSLFDEQDFFVVKV